MNTEPYIASSHVVTTYEYNPEYGDDRICECSHPYYRHFDTYEDMYACGCKYCGCYTFKEITPMSTVKEIDGLVRFLSSNASIKATTGYVLGVSGGVDSAVAAFLAKRAIDILNTDDNKDPLFVRHTKYDLHLVALPVASQSADLHAAHLVADALGVPLIVNDLTTAYEALTSQFGDGDKNLDKLFGGNIKARLRMTALYYYANKFNALVIGTDNAAETYTGYFTKHGDGAADIFPLSDYVKRDIFDMARQLGVPQEIIDRKPSAGLWDGQTDEDEMGITYEYIDNHIEGMHEANEALMGNDSQKSMEAKIKLSRLHERTAHKRADPLKYERTRLK